MQRSPILKETSRTMNTANFEEEKENSDVNIMSLPMQYTNTVAEKPSDQSENDLQKLLSKPSELTTSDLDESADEIAPIPFMSD